MNINWRWFFGFLIAAPLFWAQNPLSASTPLGCELSVTGGKTSVCQGQPLVIIAKIDDTAAELKSSQWQTDGTMLSGQNQLFARFDTGQPGTFNVSYLARDAEGREAVCKLKIEVNLPPEFEIVENFGLFRRILFKKPKPRLNIITGENHTFQWFFNGQEIPGAEKPSFRPSSPGKYHVKVTSPLGCAAFSQDIIIE